MSKHDPTIKTKVKMRFFGLCRINQHKAKLQIMHGYDQTVYALAAAGG